LRFMKSINHKAKGKTFVAKVIEAGRITIPKPLRELMGIEDGDFVELILVAVYKREKPALDSGPIAVKL